MIPDELIKSIVNETSIEAVISNYIKLKKQGKNFVGLCPFHDDKHASLSVSPAKQIYKCFACGKGGNVVKFIMEKEKMAFPDAIKLLTEKYVISDKERIVNFFNSADPKKRSCNRKRDAEALDTTINGKEVKPASPECAAPMTYEPLMPLNGEQAAVFIQAIQNSGDANWRLYLNNRSMFWLQLGHTPDMIAQMAMHAQGVQLPQDMHTPLADAIRPHYTNIVKLKIKVSLVMLNYLHEQMTEFTYEAEKLKRAGKGKKSENEDFKLLRKEIQRMRDLRKALAAYFMLRAYDDQLNEKRNTGFHLDLFPDIAKALNISKNTLINRRNLLVNLGMGYLRGSRLFLYSVSRAGNAIGCPGADFDYSYIKFITNLKKFEYAIDFLWENRSKVPAIKAATKNKISKLQEEERRTLAALCGVQPSKLNRAVIHEAQIKAFSDPTSKQRSYLSVLFMINTTDHPGYKKMSQYLSYTSIGGYAYRKRKAMEMGLINVWHRQIIDPSAKVRSLPSETCQIYTYPTARTYYSNMHKATSMRFTDTNRFLC